ncbi:hypothetical protein ACNTMW_14220 [Planosporangium sp. 12N6]|uniref:hypothetical protein n=1 Tax=Planosporangium spinosum TaxID=3402278 RepID=UPI003CF9F365
MINSLEQVSSLSREWGINEEDILLIALNSCGVRSRLDKARMRFRLRLDSRPDEQLYLILSLGRSGSPFELDEHRLCLNGRRIGVVDALEDDDAVLGYWRNGRKVLTLNSNARSQCTGCVFCPNTLEASSDPRLAALADLDAYLAAIVSDFDLRDLSEVETVTVCTGCFHYEHLAVDHLRQVRAAMAAHGCSGDIHFLSSVLTSREGLDKAAAIGPFHLTLTAECFSRRPLILKESKARLTPTQMVEVLATAKDRGIVTDFTYIVGLDSPEVAVEHLTRFVPVTTTFPRFQVYQPHNDLMDVFAADGAREIEYYLRMRRELERLFAPTGLRPRSWENYRPLWYFSFADEPLSGTRI